MSYILKTQQTDTSVISFIEKIEDGKKKEDSFILLDIFSTLSGEKAKMWGESIIGFGSYHYKYASGQEGDWMRTGFSPRKNAFSIYIMPGYQFDSMKEFLEKLGKYKLGKSCLYIKKLDDIDIQVLKEIISEGLKGMKEKYT